MKTTFLPSYFLKYIKAVSLIFLLIQCTAEVEYVEPEFISTKKSFKIKKEVEAPIPERPLITPEGATLVKNEKDRAEERFYPESFGSNTAVKNNLGVTDFIHFRDYTALSLMPNKAHNFAEDPYYIEKIGNAWVHVKENNTGNYKPSFMSEENHYHLFYEHEPLASFANYNSIIPCVTLQDGNCYEIDPALFDRRLASHNSNQWIKIYAYDQNNSNRVFDLLQIEVLYGPVQLWYKKSNGNWYKFKSVEQNVWNLSAKCTSITEVLISSAEGVPGSFSIDNIKVRIPY